MGNPFGRRQARARQEFETQLQGIISRLDTLETTLTSSMPPEKVEAIRDAIRVNLEQRFGPVESRLDGVESASEDTDRRIKALTFAVEEGIERVGRSERRIVATIKRARKELAEHGFESPGIEAEVAELRVVDGAGSAGRELPEVPPDMVEPHEEASSIRGVSAATLKRVRGF